MENKTMKDFVIRTSGGRKGGRKIATVYSFLDYPIDRKNHRLATQRLAKLVPRSKHIGFAGFSERKWLAATLLYNIFGEKNLRGQKFQISKDEILTVVSDSIRLANQRLRGKPTHVFLFPTYSSFVNKRMGGVSGYTPYKNTLLVFISPQTNKRWKGALTETICHEFVHGVMDNYYERQNLLEDLVFEGVAEYFVSQLFGLKKHLPATALTKKECRQWLTKLKDKLDARDLYYPVFLQGGDYPLWGGYAIGYRIIESFMKNHPDTSFERLVRMTPQAIFQKSGL